MRTLIILTICTIVFMLGGIIACISLGMASVGYPQWQTMGGIVLAAICMFGSILINAYFG